MTKSESITLWASIQYALLILALLGVGYLMRENPSKSELEYSTKLPLQLTITGKAVNNYPDLKFGSDISWERFYNNSKEYSNCPLFIGEGTISLPQKANLSDATTTIMAYVLISMDI